MLELENFVFYKLYLIMFVVRVIEILFIIYYRLEEGWIYFIK